jgi:hypothetical protein
MKKRITFLAVAVLSLSLFAWWYYQPERVLERKLDKLFETVAFDSSTTRTGRVVKGSSLDNFFDTQVELTSPLDQANGNFSPEDIRSAYAYLSENASEISIKRDHPLLTGIEGDHATQQCEADINIAINRWLDGPNGRYQLTLHWRKTDKGWKIHSMDANRMP